jgi:hypothetical protein
MKIIISKKTSTCEDLEEQSKSNVFSRPSGEVPELPPQRKRRAPGTATSDRVASSVKLSDLEQSVDGLATDIIDRVGPAIRSLRNTQLKNIKRQQQINQLVSQELGDIVNQIEAIKDLPKLPELDNLPPLDFKDVKDIFGLSTSPAQQQPAQSATQARINEIRIRIENK